MESFPALSRNKETIFREVRRIPHSLTFSPWFDRKTEIRECSVETVQPSARARSTATGLDR